LQRVKYTLHAIDGMHDLSEIENQCRLDKRDGPPFDGALDDLYSHGEPVEP
jgi:hypothetical protein